jgi:hypothetical protein
MDTDGYKRKIAPAHTIKTDKGVGIQLSSFLAFALATVMLEPCNCV